MEVLLKGKSDHSDAERSFSERWEQETAFNVVADYIMISNGMGENTSDLFLAFRSFGSAGGFGLSGELDSIQTAAANPKAAPYQLSY